MSNPWLKKNPFMSIWLSGANSVANSARGRVAAEIKRQSATVADQAVSEMFYLDEGTDSYTGDQAKAQALMHSIAEDDACGG